MVNLNSLPGEQLSYQRLVAGAELQSPYLQRCSRPMIPSFEGTKVPLQINISIGTDKLVKGQYASWDPSTRDEWEVQARAPQVLVPTIRGVSYEADDVVK